MTRRLLPACLLVSLLALTAPSAHADRDAVQFGSNINVAPGSTIHDAVCFFCSVRNQGTVEGDIVVFFGDVHITGQANHDVVSFFGTVRADENASITHDLVNFFGGVRLGENVSVGHDLIVMFGGLHAADSVNVGGNRVAQPAWLFWVPLFVLVTLIIVGVRELRAHRRRQMLAAYGIPPMPPPAPPVL
jgi:hypothetical protein